MKKINESYDINDYKEVIKLGEVSIGIIEGRVCPDFRLSGHGLCWSNYANFRNGKPDIGDHYLVSVNLMRPERQHLLKFDYCEGVECCWLRYEHADDGSEFWIQIPFKQVNGSCGINSVRVPYSDANYAPVTTTPWVPSPTIMKTSPTEFKDPTHDIPENNLGHKLTAIVPVAIIE